MDKLVPYYVGVSRSGCHWLRIVLEDYTENNSPLSNHLGCIDEPIQLMYKRVEAGEFKGTHDMDLDYKTDCVVYLYRNPIDCIFSNLKYDGTDISDRKAVDYYLNIWIAHISKWVYDENFTKEKVVLCYENMMEDFVSEFSKLLRFLLIPIDESKIIKSRDKYTKSKIRDIIHDKKVINIEPDYDKQRLQFKELHGMYIYDKLPQSHKNICKLN